MKKAGLLLSLFIAVLNFRLLAQVRDAGAGAVGFYAAVQPKSGMSVQVENIDITPVKAAPFCAVITTEHTQPFADGNRIHTVDNSTLCRDSEGRTRREVGLNLLGAAPEKSATKLITIVDPAAGVRYVLDTNTKTARKMPLPPLPGVTGEKGLHQSGPVIKEDRVMILRGPGEHGLGEPGADTTFGNVFINTEVGRGGPEANSENLGDQTFDGIHATGTRMTTTIAAGKMGNEQPILVTSERWYSPELKATIMTKHNDPWAGELKTQFMNVNTAEPDASLFVVPSDYKIVEEKGGPFTIKLKPPAPEQ